MHKQLTPMPTDRPCICGTADALAGKYRGASDTGGGGLKEAKDGVKLFAFGLSLNSWIRTNLQK